MFLHMNFKSYEELTDKSDWIQQFKEAVLSQPDTFLSKPSVNIENNNIIQKLYDDWNILFQPKLYKLKQQNANIFKQLPLKEVVEEVKEELNSDFNISEFYSKPFHNPFSYDFYLNPFMKKKTKLDTENLSTDEIVENVNDSSIEHKSTDIESNAEKNEAVMKSEKKFTINFLSNN